MNSLKSCYQANGEIFLVFENNLNSSSINQSNFTLSSGNVTSVITLENTINLNFENDLNRPLILTCNVEDINNFSATYSRIVALEFNYKLFNNETEIVDYLQNSPNDQLDGKLYYDPIDGKLYYDSLGSQFASDLNGVLLVYNEEYGYIKSVGLINGINPGWIAA